MKQLILFIYIKYQKRLGKKVVHFLHIGKTGGTSIRHAIAEKKSFSRTVGVTNDYLILAHGHHFKFNEVPNDEYVFFSVRDPLKKFVSGFYSAQRRGKSGRLKNQKISEVEDRYFKYYSTPNELAEALSATDSKRGIAEDAIRSIWQLKISYWDWFINENYFLENKHQILTVLRQEYLNHDFENFKREYGIKIGKLPHDTLKSHKTPDSVDKHLSETAQRNLREWYKEDYKFLDMLYENRLIKEKYPSKEE